MHGQVPYPILERLPDGVSESDVVEFLANSTGISNTLGSVLTLQQLGLHVWPLTPTGKVMKRELEAATLRYLGKSDVLSGYAVSPDCLRNCLPSSS